MSVVSTRVLVTMLALTLVGLGMCAFSAPRLARVGLHTFAGVVWACVIVDVVFASIVAWHLVQRVAP